MNGCFFVMRTYSDTTRQLLAIPQAAAIRCTERASKDSRFNSSCKTHTMYAFVPIRFGIPDFSGVTLVIPPVCMLQISKNVT